MVAMSTSSPYAADGDNFLYRCTFGGGPETYLLLPCCRTGDYTSPLSFEFVVTAWWPPSVSATAGLIHEYKAAHFNVDLHSDEVSRASVPGILSDYRK